MKDFNECLEITNNVANWWIDTKQPDPHTTLEAHRRLTGALFFLESIRSECKKKFDAARFNAIESNQSVSAAQATAEKEVPELYMLRRMMDAGYEMSGSMRTYISFMKMEKNES